MSFLLLAPAFAATMSFDLEGVVVKGDTLSLAPVGGGAVAGIDAVGHELDGILDVLLDDDSLRAGDINPVIGTKFVAGDSGWAFSGDPVGFYSYLPKGTVSARLGIGDACEVIERAADGQEDACDGDDERAGNFVFGTTTYLDTRQGQFVFGTTSYKGKPKTTSNFLYGQTVYFRTARGESQMVFAEVGGEAAERSVVANFGTDLCTAAVWQDGRLVYAGVVACEAAYRSSVGDDIAEVPYAAEASLVWSPSARADVPALTWSWTSDVHAADGWAK